MKAPIFAILAMCSLSSPVLAQAQPAQAQPESATTKPESNIAGTAQAAPSDPALKASLVNHISYSCADFKRAADWYSKIFNLDQIGATDSDVALPFGKRGEQPLGVTAKDVSLPYLIVRTRNAQSTAQNTPRERKSKALVNHIAYTIADFDKERVRTELKRLGYTKPLQDGEHSFHIVDPNGFDVQISGIAMTALGG